MKYIKYLIFIFFIFISCSNKQIQIGPESLGIISESTGLKIQLDDNIMKVAKELNIPSSVIENSVSTGERGSSKITFEGVDFIFDSQAMDITSVVITNNKYRTVGNIKIGSTMKDIESTFLDVDLFHNSCTVYYYDNNRHAKGYYFEFDTNLRVKKIIMNYFSE
ncbi:MAG TPA: hypothetical protein VJZ01_09445 [Lachnospiraceae bacterium]|nr:hypothetical protein [Lachnospiraceae bacterium]